MLHLKLTYQFHKKKIRGTKYVQIRARRAQIKPEKKQWKQWMNEKGKIAMMMMWKMITSPHAKSVAQSKSR